MMALSKWILRGKNQTASPASQTVFHDEDIKKMNLWGFAFMWSA